QRVQLVCATPQDENFSQVDIVLHAQQFGLVLNLRKEDIVFLQGLLESDARLCEFRKRPLDLPGRAASPCPRTRLDQADLIAGKVKGDGDIAVCPERPG